MRKAVAGLLAILLLTSCAPGASSQPQKSASPAPTAAPPESTHFDAYVGAYRTDAGVTLVVNGHGHFVNLQDDSIRQLYPTTTADHFTVGAAYLVPKPKQADVAFHVTQGRADEVTETPVVGRLLTAHRLQFTETEVSIPAKGAVLAGTVTQPLTPGPHPGIVIVHGSGFGPRIDYGVWVGLYASLGLTVLAYDKRGNGASTGVYPGESAADRNLNIYADDAAVVLRFLSSYPGVDPKRVGFHGGSQGGWVVPLAMQHYQAPAAFAVIVSGPAVTVDQQAMWASFSNSSTMKPTVSPSDMYAQVRAENTGYDPAPVLATITQPMLWLNGETDHQVPTAVNTEILRGLHRPNFDIQVLPGVDHGLLENPGGLEPDDPKAAKLASGLFDVIAGWLITTAGR